MSGRAADVFQSKAAARVGLRRGRRAARLNGSAAPRRRRGAKPRRSCGRDPSRRTPCLWSSALPRGAPVRIGPSPFFAGDGADLRFVRHPEINPQSAEGIASCISNSPLVFWLGRVRESGAKPIFLGVVELTTAVLLAVGAFAPVISALSALMGIVTFLVTWSFFFTTSGVVKWSLSKDPIFVESRRRVPSSRTSSFFQFASCCVWRPCRRHGSAYARSRS